MSFVGFLVVHKRSGHVTFAAFTKLERHKALVVAIFSGIEAAHQMDERARFESVLENSGEFGVSVGRVGVLAQPVQHFVESREAFVDVDCLLRVLRLFGPRQVHEVHVTDLGRLALVSLLDQYL